MRLLSCGCLFLAACSLLPDPKSANVKYCTVDPGELTRAEKGYPVRLSIRSFTAPARYGHAIAVRPSPYQITYREEVRWVEPPAELCQGAIEKIVRTSELFRPKDLDPEWQLEGRVLTFDEVHENGSVFAECTIQFEIFRRRGGEKIWSQTFTARNPAGSDTLPEGMSKSVRQVGEKLVAALVQADLK